MPPIEKKIKYWYNIVRRYKYDNDNFKQNLASELENLCQELLKKYW